MSRDARTLRARAEEQAAPLPPLLARAEQLAGAVMMGEHGRRRAGLGADFWQYRPMQQGDSLRNVDWRRSARGDTQFVREHEWQIAQTVMLWVDGSAAMRFGSSDAVPQKQDRARLLALAVSILLDRGGERVGLLGDDLPPRKGRVQLMRLAQAFNREHEADYGLPEIGGIIPHGRAVVISDFLGDLEPVQSALTAMADKGVQGILVQVLDPSEEVFPFHGRTRFQSIGGSLSHETLKADALRPRYLQRLAARKAALNDLTRLTGWRYLCHHTDDSAQSALLWLWRALDGGGAA